MGKKILLKMSDDKDIIITLDDENEHIISHDQREINAEQIFKLLDYKIGDTYTVETVNEHKLDPPVFTFFSSAGQEPHTLRILFWEEEKETSLHDLPPFTDLRQDSGFSATGAWYHSGCIRCKTHGKGLAAKRGEIPGYFQ